MATFLQWLLCTVALALIVLTLPYILFHRVRWKRVDAELTPFIESFTATDEVRTKYRVRTRVTMRGGVSFFANIYPVGIDNQFDTPEEASAKVNEVRELKGIFVSRLFPWVKFVVPNIGQAGRRHALSMFCSGCILLLVLVGVQSL